MISQPPTDGDRPLRILQLGSTAYRGGVTTAVLTLCTALHQQGQQVMLICDGGDLDHLSNLGIDCHVTDFAQRPLSILRSAWFVHRAIRQFRPDVIHVHGRSPALLCHLAGRIPDWFTLHNTHFTERVGAMDFGILRRLLSPTGRRFFVLDEQARTYLHRTLGVSPTHVEVIFNGVDCDRYHEPTAAERQHAREHFGIQDDQTLVLFVGRLHPSKQPEAVVEAAKVLRAHGRTDVQFAIVGEGELEQQVHDAIEAAGGQTVCKQYGWMDPLEAYFAGDLLVMPSLYEGFGMVAVEAMATGLPVLRSRTGGADRMIVEGKTGFCCDIEAHAFIESLERILQQPEHLQAMHTTARNWIVDHLSAQAQARTILGHYRAHLRRR